MKTEVQQTSSGESRADGWCCYRDSPISFVQHENLKFSSTNNVLALAQEKLLDPTRSPNDNVSTGGQEAFYILCRRRVGRHNEERRWILRRGVKLYI